MLLDLCIIGKMADLLRGISGPLVYGVVHRAEALEAIVHTEGPLYGHSNFFPSLAVAEHMF